MENKFVKLLSLLLVTVLLCNMLPLGSMAQKLYSSQPASSITAATSNVNASKVAQLQDAQILAEIPEKRTEYSKEFLLSNGLHMATVYADAVHYRTDKGWEDIDNTLVAKDDGTYATASGPWSVVFPQELTADNRVTVSIDGYSLSFEMEGQIKKAAALQRTSEQSLLAAQDSTAVVRQPGAMLKEMGLQEDKSTPQKLYSRLTYANVFENTDVMYDLDAYAVKESIVLQQYDAALEGYRYTLYTGKLTPVMDDSGHIDLYAPKGKEPVMSLPSPYLLDNNGAYCDQVQVSLTGGNGIYTLTYTLPQQWLASPDRAWPVILDPIVTAAARTHNIQDRTISEKKVIAVDKSLFYAGYADNHGKIRGFLQYNALPALTSSDVVINATFGLYKIVNSSPAAPIEIHKVNGPWTSVDITWENQPTFNTTVVDYADVGSKGYYYWDITDLVNDWYTEANNGLMIKMSDAVENGTTDRFRQFYSVEAGTSYRPKLEIVFRNNNGLESYWDYTSASAGRAGTGYVNNFTGNLVWTRGELGFGGNRMPVSITRVYNLNDSTVPVEETDNNANNTGGNYFGMGNGWRSNLSQRVFQWSKNSSYYVWEDADGTDIYFKKTATSKYTHEDNPNIILKTNGTGTKKYQITDQYGNITYFDTKGRLTEIRNNQSTTSSVTLTYTTDSSQLIDTVRDGVGRSYQFTYTNGLLTRIGYYGTGTTELTYVAYSYDASGNLTGITDKDDETCTYSYAGNVLTGAEDIDGYKLTYTYNIPEESFQPYRVIGVAAYDGSIAGGTLDIDYSRNQTVFTDHNGTVRIYQFNDFGHTVSIQDDEGRAQFTQYPFFTDTDRDNNTDATKHKNLPTQASKMQNTVSNLLPDSSFEGGTVWHPPGTTAYSNSVVSTQSYHGSKALSIQHGGGAITQPIIADDGIYTFSAYVKTTGAQARLAVRSNGVDSYSLYLPANSDWTRLEVSCQGVEDAILLPIIETLGSGYTYVDCVQLETAPTASRYNLIQNGDFRYGLDQWTGTDYTLTTAESTAAPQLDSSAVSVTGDYKTKKALTQTVTVAGNAGDTIVLTGWTKADSVAMGQSFHTQDRQFGLTGVFTYTDGTKSDPFPVTFNPDAGSDIRWQFSAAPMVAKKAYSGVTVSICYDYNMNTALFDGIGLYKEEFGASYTYDEDGNVISILDLEKQETTYEYDTDNNLTKIVQGDKIKMTYSYDDWHNVTSATTEEGQVYEFTYDVFGNNTHVSITADGLTMETSAVYTGDGNRLVSTTDALGKVTTYDYDADTNLLNSVKYPEDTDETKTTYTYDSMYRLARTEAAIGEGAAQTLYASYTYEDDRLKSIATPTTTYSFTYGEFGTRTNVQVGTRTLATYSYTPDQNRYLEAMTYGNGDRISYEYDSKGRLICQTYEDGDTVTYQYDNNGALATVTDSATGITTKYYYDFTDRLLAYEENSDGYSLKTGYTYDTHNNLTEVIQTVNGTAHVTAYTYNEDNRLTSMTADGVTVEYTYDGFGRLTGQVTRKDGATVLTETFTYTTVDGKTSSQIASYSTVTATGTTAYSYTYDGNGNILSVSDGTNTTSYVYDSQNQLVRENNQAGNFTHTWVYDNAGNIEFRYEYPYTTGELGAYTKEIAYRYDDESWGDLLTSYDGVAITYDAIGNPDAIGGWAFTWEHGRQLAAMSNGTTTWTNTYNADGLRIKRTNGSKTYSYIYTGSTLTQMTVGSDTLYFTYDASGIPLTVTHNGTTYYYATNLQGDIVAILDANGAAVVTYTYDAWGNPLTTTGTMASTLGAVNPLRYRGYIYDAETELYYLQSRYYNPEIGRFINADGYTSTGDGLLGNNLFSYCYNNPVIYIDHAGNWPELQKDIQNIVDIATHLVESCIESIFVIKYDVPLYDQGSLKLCWAFSQIMIEDFRAGIVRTPSQATAKAKELAISVNGQTNWDKGAWPPNASQPFAEFNKPAPTLFELYIALLCRGPFYAYYTGTTASHLVVVTGVDIKQGIIYTNNSWYVRGIQSYDEFMKGVANQPINWDMSFGFLIYPDL